MKPPRNPIVLVLADHYLPGFRAGGPIRSIANLVAALGDRYDFRVIAKDRDHTQAEPYPQVEPGLWTKVGNGSVLYSSKRQLRLGHLGRAVRGVQPDLVFANSLFSPMTLRYLLLRRFGRLERAPLLLAPRGELGDGALSIKPLRKRMVLLGLAWSGLLSGIEWQASSATEEKAIAKRVNGSSPAVVPNLTAAPPTKPVPPLSKEPGSARFVFVGRLSPKKNLPFLLDALAQISGEVRLDIYGPLEAAGRVIKHRLVSMPDHVVVEYHGEIQAAEKQTALRDAHFSVLPTLDESFGHSVYEALRIGRPVVISDRTPWGAVREKGAGRVLSLERPADWVQALQECVDLDSEAYVRQSVAAHSYALQWFEHSDAIRLQADLFDTLLA